MFSKISCPELRDEIHIQKESSRKTEILTANVELDWVIVYVLALVLLFPKILKYYVQHKNFIYK